MTDPVAHLRTNMKTRIDAWSPEQARSFFKVFRNFDDNMKKPVKPAGWLTLKEVAKQLGRNVDHLGRQCKELYAAQDLARICTIRGRNTWCLSPEAIARMSAVAAQAKGAPAAVAGADEAQGEASASTRSTSGQFAPEGGSK